MTSCVEGAKPRAYVRRPWRCAVTERVRSPMMNAQPKRCSLGTAPQVGVTSISCMGKIMGPEIPALPFSECEPATDDRPLQQGDVVEHIAKAPDLDIKYGIVVTADCDIAQLKHNNTLSYVPLFSLPSTLITFFFPRRFEKAISNARRDLTRLATAMRQQVEPAASSFSEEAIEIWLQSTDGPLAVRPARGRHGRRAGLSRRGSAAVAVAGLGQHAVLEPTLVVLPEVQSFRWSNPR